MTDRAKSVSHPWRRFLRFSVRGMIVLVLVVGGWLGWLVRGCGFSARRLRRLRKQGQSSAMIGSGATVRNARWKTLAPRWLVDHFGVDYFGRVSLVSFAAHSR